MGGTVDLVLAMELKDRGRRSDSDGSAPVHSGSKAERTS